MSSGKPPNVVRPDFTSKQTASNVSHIPGDVLIFSTRMKTMEKGNKKKDASKDLSKGDKVAEIVRLLYSADEKEIEAILEQLHKVKPQSDLKTT